MQLHGRIAETAARPVLELELLAVGLPLDEVLETGGDSSHSDEFRTERCAWSLKQASHFPETSGVKTLVNPLTRLPKAFRFCNEGRRSLSGGF